jgi:hypothetical protein
MLICYGLRGIRRGSTLGRANRQCALRSRAMRPWMPGNAERSLSDGRICVCHDGPATRIGCVELHEPSELGKKSLQLGIAANGDTAAADISPSMRQHDFDMSGTPKHSLPKTTAARGRIERKTPVPPVHRANLCHGQGCQSEPVASKGRSPCTARRERSTGLKGSG